MKILVQQTPCHQSAFLAIQTEDITTDVTGYMSYNCSGTAHSADLVHDSVRATGLLIKKDINHCDRQKTALFSLSELRHQIDPLLIKTMTARN